MRSAILALVGCSVFATMAFGEDEPAKPLDPESIIDTFGKAGYSHALSTKPCSITSKFNEEEFTKSLPIFRSMGLLNENATDDELRLKPYRFITVIALDFASLELRSMYDLNPDVDKCSISFSIDSLDDFGNAKLLDMFSFSLDRKTYKQINWGHFQTINFFKIGKNLKFGPEYQKKFSEEQ